MALYYELPIYRDTYNLLLKVFEVTKSFPREYKFTLGQDMKRDCMELVRYIYKANRATVKTEHLEAYLEQFEMPWPSAIVLRQTRWRRSAQP